MGSRVRSELIMGVSVGGAFKYGFASGNPHDRAVANHPSSMIVSRTTSSILVIPS